jgi:CheY-like chemotaxis protein
MKPARRILLCCSDEDRLGVMAYTLSKARVSCNGPFYGVTKADTLTQALSLILDLPAVVLIFAPFAGEGALLQTARRMNREIHTIVVRDDASANDIGADAVLSKPTMAELLNTLAVHAQRKRGPKPPLPPVAVVGGALVARYVDEDYEAFNPRSVHKF